MAAVAALVAATAVPVVEAQGIAAPDWLRGLLPGQGAQPPADPLAALNLTDAQRMELGELAKRQAERQRETGQQLAEIQSRIPSLYAAERLDEEAIADAFSALFELQKGLIVEAARTYNAQLDVLDDEQRSTWKQLKARPRQPGS